MYLKTKYRKLASYEIMFLLMVSFLIVPLLSAIPVSGAPGPWWNADWAYRKTVTVDHTKVVGSLNEFPVLVDLTDADLASSAQSDGDDIAFVDVGTNTKLNHEIEYFDSSTGHLIVWVKVSSLSQTTDTVVYMYYGNPIAGNQQNVQDAWDSNAKMVLHLNQTSGTQYDSSANANNALPYGGVLQGVPGKIAGADDFDGVNDYLQVAHSGSITGFTSAFTASFWVRLDDLSRRQVFLNKYDSAGNQRGWLIEYNLVGGQPRFPAFFASQDGVSYKEWYSSFNPLAGVWYYVTVVWRTNALPTFYINGQQVPTVQTGTISSIYNNVGAPLHVGKCTYATGREMNGNLDEICLSNVARSVGWVGTSYNNQASPSTFYSVGPEEVPAGGAPSISNESPANGALNVYTNPTLSVFASDPDGDLMTVIFETNATGTWEDIAAYSNVGDGTYTCIPTDMNQLGTRYFWSVSVTDNGTNWTTGNYTFTTTASVLTAKWTATGTPYSSTGVLIADVVGDSKEEIIQVGLGKAMVLNGTTGSVIWSRDLATGIQFSATPEIADLNKDGILEIVIQIDWPPGVLVLHANDGSTYWTITNLGGGDHSGSPVIADIDGNGYPTIFVTTATEHTGLNSTSQIYSISYDGHVLHQTFAWHTCAGGLSIGDTDDDGEFELYVGDRNRDYSGDGGIPRGLRSFWASNLTVRWEHPEILCSSNRPMLADVNKDGILDVIIGHHSGGIGVFNSKDGSAIREDLNLGRDLAPVHYQPSVYDIDEDGNLEMIMQDAEHTTAQPVVWDLVQWKLDARLPVVPGKYGPQIADVTGDGHMDIIVCNDTDIFVFDKNYTLVAQVKGLLQRLMYAVVQDIDGDGYNEVVVNREGTSGRIYAFDTPARTPIPRPRTEVRFYSERRNGVQEYVPLPGSSSPVISDPSPVDGATKTPTSLSQLAFTLADFQNDPIDYTVTTVPDVGSGSGTNVANGRYYVSVTGLEPSTTYTWEVSANDGTDSTSKVFTFTTESEPAWWNTQWQFRRTISVDHTRVSGDQTDFPLLIDLTDSSLGSKTNDGHDIAFVDADNAKLDHQISLYDPATGHLIAWVRLPSLSSTTDTAFYMYYGNPTCPNQENSAAVWESSYKMVLHLDEMTDPHECRLWGMTANSLPEQVVLDQLINLPYSLKNLGGGVAPNDDGWGLAYYVTAEPTVLRGEPMAYTDPNFNLAAAQLASSGATMAVGHVRNAASGATEIPDPHPFMRFKNGKWWAFGHNGVLSKTVLKTLIGSAYLAANPPTVGDNWDDPDVVDTDLYMLYVLKCIEEAGWNVQTGIAKAVVDISESTSGAMNFFLTDGNTLWGFRKGNTLYYYYDPQYSVIASQPPGTYDGWTQLSDFNLITLNKGTAPVIIQDIRDYDPTSQCYDSTVNANNGVLYGGVTQAAQGQINGANRFDGSTGYIQVPHSNTLTGFTQAFTARFWIKLEDTARRQTILNKYNTAGNQRAWYIEYQNHATFGKVLGFFASQNGAGWQEWYTAFNPTAATWYFVTVVWQTNTIPKFYVNGQQVATINTGTLTSIYNNAAAPLHIGKSTYTTGRVLKGSLDEIRISNTARTAGYTLTCYNNEKSPTQFCMIGTEESLPSQPIVSNPTPLNAATNVPITLSELSFDLTDYQDLMTYSVSTTPNVGSGSGTGVGTGSYSVSVSGLQYSTTYTWHVSVTDGTYVTSVDYTFTTEAEVRYLVDSEFSDSTDSIDLRANNTSQDWYESRGAFPTGADPTLLTLDTANIGGNTGKKAALKNNLGVATNAYLTQEFASAQTSTFDISFDIFIDRIEDSANYDRTGNIYIGDDRVTTDAPTGQSNERFVCLAFYDPTPGDTGNDIILKARTLSSQSFATTSQWITVATGLNYDAWITIKLTVDPASGTYDVYVDGILKGNFNKYGGYTPTQETYVSFVADSDARGVFYVDNVFSPAQDRYKITVTTSGSGSVQRDPGEATYAPYASVQLTALADAGFTFSNWEGDLSGNTNPTTIAMTSDKSVTAVFTQTGYTLTVNVVGSGTVTRVPDQATYEEGTEVTLTATPEPGATFTGWSGDLSGSESPTTLTMDSNKFVTATFTTVSYDDVIFDSSFDMGNLKNVLFQSGDGSGNRFYTGEQEHTTVSGMADKHWWFYFSMDQVAGKTVKISLVNNEAADFSGNRWTEIEPVFSYDNVNWERVPLSGVTYNSTARSFTMTVSVPLGQSRIWLAPLPPYNIAKRDALFAEFASSPYLTVTSLGTTPGGQQLKVATITDPAYSDAGKFKSYVIGQQHAGEVQGSWNAEGLIRFLLSDDPTAIAIRRSYIFKIVPIVNVDGVFQGISRYTPLRSGVQYDLNRDWTTRTQPEIQRIWNDLLSFQPDSFNDMHSTINTEVGSPKELLTYTWSTSDPAVIAFRAKIKQGGFPETVTGVSGYACTQVHNLLNIEESVSWENPFDELSTNPGVKLTVNDWMTWGAAWAKGNYLYFGKAQGTLATSVTGSGSITVDPNQTTYDYGSSVTLTAVPAEGWYFAGWSGDLSGTINPTAIVISGSNTVTATFTENPVSTYTLTINVVGQGHVDLDQVGPYPEGTVVELTAVADAGWSFSEWGGALSGSVNPTSITMDSDKSVTATFTQNEYTLTVDVSPDGSGTVDVSPVRATYHYGDSVTLTPSAADGWTFAGWTDGYVGFDDPLVLTIYGDTSVTATFTQVEYSIDVTVHPSSAAGSVSADLLGPYHLNDVVTLTPSANSGYTFSGWSGDGVAGAGDTWVVTVTGNMAVTATFTQDQYTLTVTTVGNGIVTKSPDLAFYDYGDVVQLTADPDDGWSFAGWSVDLSGTVNPESINMTGSKSVTATFTQDLKIHLPFSDNTVPIPDTSGNGNVGTPYNGVAWQSTYGGVYSFDGANDYITVADSPSLDGRGTLTQLTVEFWVRPDSAAPSGQRILRKGPSAGTGVNSYQVGFQTSAPNRLYFDVWHPGSAAGTYYEVEYTTLLTAGTWYHVVCVYDTIVGSKIYVNGVDVNAIYKAGTATGNVGGSVNQPLYIGCRYNNATSGPNQFFDGLIDDVQIYSVALSSGVVQQHYDATKAVHVDYTLTVNTIGSGTVTKNPTQAAYAYGTNVELTAVPDSGWVFSGWSGALSGSANPESITIDGDKSVTATFTQDQYTLTVTTVGNGIVTKSPDLAFYDYGDVVQLTADPDDGWSFAGWSVDLSGTVNPESINMTGSKSVTATFTQITHTITASAGAGGSISPSGAVTVADGVDQLFTIAADSGYEIADVLVDSVSVGAVSEYTFPDVSADHTITATFIQNQAPMIDSYTPTSDYPCINQGSQQAFTISASDPDGDPLTIQWYLDGTSTSTTESYTFDAVSGTSGVRNVTVEVVDGFGGKATRMWFLTVDATLVMPFDTNVSPTIDYAGGDNTGTVNGATWTSDGKVGGCYSFDGTNDDITIADASNLDGDGLWTEITIEHWIYLAADQTGRRTITKYSATAEAKRSYQIGFQTATPANRLYGAVIIGSNSYQEAAYNTSLIAGVWYHVVLTYKSGDTLRLYLNGVQVAALGTLTGNIQASPDKPLYIGRRYETTGTFFNGKIDEVRIYPKALTPEQINQNYIQEMAFFTGPSGDPMLSAIATVLNNPAVLGLPMTMCAFVLCKTRRRKKQIPSIPFFGPLHY